MMKTLEKEPPSSDDLSRLLLFQGESPDALEWLLDASFVSKVPAGEILLRPGETNNLLRLILEGTVRVQLSLHNDEVLTYLEAGNCIGEMSIIEQASVSAYAIADTDCRLLVIDEETLWSLINRSFNVARNLLYILSSRVRHNNSVLVESLQQQRFFEQMSKVDVLTGLYNRRWLDEKLNSMVERCHYKRQQLSLIMLDIDHFKAYNDTHGHLAGDRALKAMARAIPNHIRPNDAAARYGGEEFVIILPDTDEPVAYFVAERLREGVQTEPILCADDSPLPSITVSVGVSTLVAGQSGAELLAAADAALYRAKHAGRNQVAC